MGYYEVKNILPQDICDFIKVFVLKDREYEYKPCNTVYGSHVCLNLPFHITISEYIKSKLEDTLNTKLKYVCGYSRTYGKRDEIHKQEDKVSYDYCTTITIGFEYEGKDSDYRWPCYINDNNKNENLTLDIGDGILYKNEHIKYGRDPLLAGKDSYHIQLYMYYLDENLSKVEES